jgi:hypothetical protein
MRAIAHQQLHGRAALAILARFEALYPAGVFPPPDLVLASRGRVARVRLFGAKIAAMRAICAARGRHGADAARFGTAVGWGLDRATDHDPRRWALDGGDAADLHAGPTGRCRWTISVFAMAIGRCMGWNCRRSRRHWPRSAGLGAVPFDRCMVSVACIGGGQTGAAADVERVEPNHRLTVTVTARSRPFIVSTGW